MVVVPVVIVRLLVLVTALAVAGQDPTRPPQSGARGGTPPPAGPGAQRPRGARAPADRNRREERSTQGEPIWVLKLYSQSDARRAFCACDLNGDDGITFLEARRTLRDVKAVQDFRQFDQDGDGTVYFDEFDLRFRNLVQLGSTLTLMGPALTRELRPDPTAGQGRSEQRALRVLREVDADRDGRLSLDEWLKLANVLGSAAEARKTFDNLDVDQSRDLSLSELRDFAARVWLVQETPPPAEDEEDPRPPDADAGNRLVRLPPEVAAADTDEDGVLSLKELTYALLRLDPRLERFAAEILETVDLNGDGRIGPREAARIDYPRLTH